jgi:hypothetical protein
MPEESPANDEEPASTLSLNVRVDSTRCEFCGEEIWIAEETCPFCGTDRTPGTEADAHIYRSRVAVFGAAAHAFREPSDATGVVPVSDWQYLRFLRDSRVLDTEQSDEAQRAVDGLDMSSPEKVRSREAREAAEAMARNAHRSRRVLRGLKSLRPSGRFAEVHPHFVAALDAHRTAFAEVVEGLVSWSVAEAQGHADAVQPALDTATEEINLARRKMDEAFPDGLVEDSAEERITSFVLGTLVSDPEDPADALNVGLGSVDGFMARGLEGYAYFSDLLSTPLEEMPEGVPQALYLLALILSGQEDPAGVLHRAGLFLEVLNGALRGEREAMLGAAVKVQQDLNEAAGILLALAPQVDRVLSTPDMTDDAVRDFVVQVYGRLLQARGQPAALRHVRSEGLPQRVGGHLRLGGFRGKASVAGRRRRRSGVRDRPGRCGNGSAQLGCAFRRAFS